MGMWGRAAEAVWSMAGSVSTFSGSGCRSRRCRDGGHWAHIYPAMNRRANSGRRSTTRGSRQRFYGPVSDPALLRSPFPSPQPAAILGAVRIHPFNQSPILQTDTVARPSAFSFIVTGFVLLLFPCIGLFMIRTGAGAFGWWVLSVGMFVLLFFGPRAVRVLRGTISEAIWLLRWNPRQILIRLGELSETDPAALASLELPWSDIEWARRLKRTTITHTSERCKTSTIYLQLKLRPTDLAELAEKLTDVSGPVVRTSMGGHCTTTIYRQIPVTLSPDGVLSIEFSGAIAWISPRLRSTLHQFSDYGVNVLPEISEVIDFTRSHADSKKLDDEILRLAQSGQTLPAIELTRKRYGYSLAQARQFVQDLITPVRE